MRRNRKLLVAAVGAALLIGGGLGVARATGSDDHTKAASPTTAVGSLDNSGRGQGPAAPDGQDDFRIGGSAAERATAAARAAVAGATVQEVERTTDPENPQRAYEVKLTTADGALVEVYLDADFTVVEIERAHGGKDHDG